MEVCSKEIPIKAMAGGKSGHASGVRDVTLGYDRHPAIHHLNGVVEAGTLLAVVGPNGAGKSTLFKGIIGAIKPIAAQDSPIYRRRLTSTALFRCVYDMVAMGLWRRIGLLVVSGKMS